jgi:acylphosphatase
VNDLEKVRLHAMVEGSVQGVGFRAFVQDQATRLGIVGWVRNRWDGSVEVMAEGERLQLEKLLTALYQGPRAAYVAGVAPTWLTSTGEFSSFQVRMTSG